MANLHLFFDFGLSIPTGWTLVSDSAFLSKFIRGNSIYGGTGGTTTHNHSMNLASCSLPSDSKNTGGASSGLMSTSVHTHTFSGALINNGNNLPLYRTLKVIKCNSPGTPDTIPGGAIAIFDTSSMTGYTRYSAHDGYHIYGTNSGSTSTGGANTHNHQFSPESSDSSTDMEYYNSTGTTATNSYYLHTHSISSSNYTDYANNEPPYITAYLGKKDSDGSPTYGIIGMWDDIPPEGWTILSDIGGDFYQKVIKAENGYGTTGGNTFHTHSDKTVTSFGPSSHSHSDSSSTTQAASDIHTHNFTFSFDSADSLSPYIDVIFARLDPPLPPPATKVLKVWRRRHH